ncbi:MULTISPECIES: type III secretion system stator protein SctL [Myxococcaceae]|uniref:type III secretion system stator protein SctL n=1 Tax=Myxococcaceae TaxID=31 RepID=UPI00188FB255|nr:type III secretion system stator protein SctL [Simulacricoccus sp. 17bor-14]
MASGKVIKAEGSGRGGVVSAEVYDAHQAAQALLEEARREREQLLAQAQREREAVLAEARAQGRQEGLAQVTEERLRARAEAAALLARTEQDAVALALRIAARLLGRDVERSPELLVDLCASALAQLRGERAVVLRVHPDAAAELRQRRPELLARLAPGVDVTLKEDPSVQRVGCILETDSGTLDAQLDTQLQMLERVLLPEGAR